MARPRPSDLVRIIREIRVWEEKYDIIAGVDHYTVTIRDRRDLTRELVLETAVDRHGKVHWYDEGGNGLPKSVGWVVREFALESRDD